jgi:hypothetical protein
MSDRIESRRARGPLLQREGERERSITRRWSEALHTVEWQLDLLFVKGAEEEDDSTRATPATTTNGAVGWNGFGFGVGLGSLARC